MFVVKNSAVQ